MRSGVDMPCGGQEVYGLWNKLYLVVEFVVIVSAVCAVCAL